MFEDDVSIRTIGEVERKLDRFNRVLRGDSRDKAMEAFFGNEVWPALDDAVGNFHFTARNPDRYNLDSRDGLHPSAYELAAGVSDGLCRMVAPVTTPWRSGEFYGLACCIAGVGSDDMGRARSTEFMLGEIDDFVYGGRPARGNTAISLIADAIREAPDPDEMLGYPPREWSREEKMEYIKPLVVYSRLAYAHMQYLRDMLNRNNFKKM